MLNIFNVLLIFLFGFSNLQAQTSKEDIAASISEYDQANIAMIKEQDQQAYQHLQNAARLDPNNSTFINSAAYMAMQLGHFKISLDYLDQALKLDSDTFGDNHPNVASILNNIGSVYSEMGDSRKAVEYYDQAYAIIAGELGEKHPQAQNVKRIRDTEATKLQ